MMNRRPVYCVLILVVPWVTVIFSAETASASGAGSLVNPGYAAIYNEGVVQSGTFSRDFSPSMVFTSGGGDDPLYFKG